MENKERPILFNGDMVRALLDGRKTQTRRVVKDQLPQHKLAKDSASPSGYSLINDCYDDYLLKCPYGKAGDVLYVRETFANIAGFGFDKDLFPNGYAYRADCRDIDSINIAKEYGVKWKPSIHMPKLASRIKLKITDIRVERLNDISEDDAKSEGLIPVEYKGKSWAFDNSGKSYGSSTGAFNALWQSINGKDSWEQNPWVWVVEFRLLENS